MQEKSALIEQTILIRGAIPVSLHRQLRSLLAARGETIQHWIIRVAQYEVRMQRLEEFLGKESAVEKEKETQGIS